MKMIHMSRSAAMLLGLTITWLGTAAQLCGWQGDLRHDLDNLSEGKGIALARLVNSGVAIFPFGAKGFERFLGNHRFPIARFSPDGRSIVGHQDTSIFVANDHGTIVWKFDGATMVHAIAVSPDGQRVAFVGVDHSTTIAGVYWTERGSPDLKPVQQFGRYAYSLQAGRSGIDKSLSESASIGWSEDNNKIVFSSAHKVQIFDVTLSSGHAVAEGDNPSWSPDGKWIAYRSVNGYAFLIGSDGLGKRSLGTKRKIMSMIHWSPNSQFVFVDEEWGNIAPQAGCVTNTRLVVYRLRDGASLPVYDPCGLRDSFFGWISDFRDWGSN